MKFITESWKRFLNEEEVKCVENPNCNCIDSSYHSNWGLSIADVQNFLYKNGYKNYLTKTFKTGYADNQCGQETKGAISAFQKTKKLKKCDACVGPETWGAMTSMGLKPSSKPENPTAAKGKESQASSSGSGEIVREKISEGVWYIGTKDTKRPMVTVHVVGSGSQQDPKIVSEDILKRFKKYIISQGDVVVSMYGNKYQRPTADFVKKGKYSKVRIVGFSRGARSPGGAMDYAKRHGKSSDELVLLDPSLPWQIKDMRLPPVSKIFLFCGSPYMAKTFKSRWDVLVKRLKKEKPNSVIDDTPSKTPGFSGHISYFNRFYNDPSAITTSSSSAKITKTPEEAGAPSGNSLDTSKPYVIPFDMSLSAFSSIRISGFGQQRKRNTHAGVDYNVPNGTPVYAIADGIVSKSYFLGDEKYKEMTTWLLAKIKKDYNHELKFIASDYKRILGSNARILYSTIAAKKSVPSTEAYYELRDLFKAEDSPYKRLTKPSHGRWHAGISLRLEHSSLKTNPKELKASRYLHMQEVFVKGGDVVKKGQLIGTVGKSGIFESGDHLHMEIYAPDKKGREWLQDKKFVGYKKSNNV